MGSALVYGADCTLGDPTACFTPGSGANISVTKQSSDDYYKFNDMTITNNQDITGLKANNTILQGNLTVTQGGKITSANFQNSVFVGNLKHQGGGAGIGKEANFTFNGSYGGSTQVNSQSVAGYAFVGNIYNGQIYQLNPAGIPGGVGTTNITFQNGANMKGNIIGGRGNQGYPNSSNMKVTFEDSKLEGNINADGQTNTIQFISTGKPNTQGAYMKGNVTGSIASSGGINLNVSTQNASIDGNINISAYPNALATPPTGSNNITLSFDGNGKGANGDEQYAVNGNISLIGSTYNPKGSFTLELKNGAKVATNKDTGIIVGVDKIGDYGKSIETFNLNLTNEAFDANQIKFINAENTIINLDGATLQNAQRLVSSVKGTLGGYWADKGMIKPITFNIQNSSENTNNGISSGDLINPGTKMNVNIKENATLKGNITNNAGLNIAYGVTNKKQNQYLVNMLQTTIANTYQTSHPDWYQALKSASNLAFIGTLELKLEKGSLQEGTITNTGGLMDITIAGGTHKGEIINQSFKKNNDSNMYNSISGPITFNAISSLTLNSGALQDGNVTNQVGKMTINLNGGILNGSVTSSSTSGVGIGSTTITATKDSTIMGNLNAGASNTQTFTGTSDLNTLLNNTSLPHFTINLTQSTLLGNINTIAAGAITDATIKAGAMMGAINTQDNANGLRVSNVTFSSYDVPPASSESKDSKASTIDFSKATLASNTPQAIQDYLRQAGIGSFVGDINNESHTSFTNIDFKDALYLGGNINTQDGTTNVTLNLSDGFSNALVGNETTKNLLQNTPPVFNVNTTGGTANIAIGGNIKGGANFNYSGGHTNVIFADKVTPPADDSDTYHHMGDSTNFNPAPDSKEANAYDPTSSDTNKNTAKVNGYTYNNGIIIRLDADKATSILKKYRDDFDSLPLAYQTLFGSPTATGAAVSINVDKTASDGIYTANISGILVGDVHSLPKATEESKGAVSNYQAIFNQNAVFIGDLNITDANVAIKLNQGAKLILSNGSYIRTLEGNNNSIDKNNLKGDTLFQTNTIIDLASLSSDGNTLNNLNTPKENYATLSIGNVKDLNDVVFRVAYNPLASNADKPNADRVIILGADTTPQKDYLQVFQTTTAGSEGGNDSKLGDLSDKNILVASVKNDASSHFAFYDKSIVTQGFDDVITTFRTQTQEMVEEKNAAGVVTNVKPKEDGDKDNIASFTNYYINSVSATINAAQAASATAVIANNYSIFLANINDLNKRLGELRDNPATQGVWARIFNGKSSSNRGAGLHTYSTNIQGGYDYAFSHNDARSIVGLALSYGYNSIKSSSTSFNNTITGKANLFEVGAYYSFIQENAQ
ncbi:hypothetical protein, partial [Helicobacter sp. 11S02596-1]|uniref:beta strand repeat-containing protein n=1 Tax=Helicobacter sp. 11S02596-1 TaxID=1476194 RepID=UPI00117ADF19